MKAILLAVLVAAVSAQNPDPPVVNSYPINNFTAAACNADPRILIADAQSICHFYVCIIIDGLFRLTPRECGLGSHVHSNFVSGLYNPCTQRFPINDMYNCNRSEVSSCETRLNCTHNATLQREGDLCWCNCSLEWQGSPDCSVPRSTNPMSIPNTVCPDGVPLDNWCARALPNGTNPCRNGGTCINQCTNFVCKCTVPYVIDKLCNTPSGWSAPIQWPEDVAMPNTVITVLPPGSTVSYATQVEISIIADKKVLCWYWIYIKHINISFIQLVPKQCASTLRIPSSFVTGSYYKNPCTERMTYRDRSCLRPLQNTSCMVTKSTCRNRLNCMNGATLQQEGDLCWCNCSLEWQGAPDCSVPKRTTPMPPPIPVCPDGAPLDNWCAKALLNGTNPCQNGGICINQCTNFVCNCTVPYVVDKLCNERRSN